MTQTSALPNKALHQTRRRGVPASRAIVEGRLAGEGWCSTGVSWTARHTATRVGRYLAPALIVFVLGGTACAHGPSLASYKGALQEASGPQAIACGVVPLGGSRRGAVSCAEAAIKEKQPFYAAFQVQGIDSVIYVGLASGSSGEAKQATWDSDIKGGSSLFGARSKIFWSACRNPLLNESAVDNPIRCAND